MAEEESFKVTDRRGRSKEEADTGDVRSASVEPTPTVVSNTHQSHPGGAEPHGPDLESLFVMFASSALISLGEEADPSTGERYVDLDQARDAIDMLALLRDKTSGNRSVRESRLLEQMLHDLQVRFVRAAEGDGPR